MKPSLKYWIFILGITGVIFGVILSSVVGSWLSLTAGEQQIVAGMADKILPYPLLGAMLLTAVICGLVTLLFRSYIIPILRMSEATQLISLANPDYRITPEGGREVVHLARIINAAAEESRKLNSQVESAIRLAQAEVREERNRFAALMSELPLGVMACDIDGRILLYNQQAQTLLHLPTQGSFPFARPGGWLGLGRSLFGLLPREPITHELNLLQQATERGEAAPTASFMTTLNDGRRLRLVMAPVFGFRCEEHELCIQCERRRMTGVVLTLEEATSRGDTPAGIKLRLPTPMMDIRSKNRPLPGSRPVYYEFDLFNQGGAADMGSLPLRKLTYVVFDTETTGLNPAGGDEIIQIGAVRIVNGRILQGEVIDQLVDPRRAIPHDSTAIHGITGEMVSGQPTVAELLPHFHRFVDGAVLVAHNAAFDLRFLQLKERESGVSFNQPVLDTLLLSSIIHPHQESHSLEGIARRLNLTVVGRHTALGDALVTAELLLKLIPLLEARGIMTLDDAVKASRASSYAGITY